MSEKPESIESIQVYIDIAKSPVPYISRMKADGHNLEKICHDLTLARRKIAETLSEQVIADVDTDFVSFFKAGNADVVYYQALFSILKRAGFRRDEIQDFTMSHTMTHGDNDQKKLYIKVTEEAFSIVFNETD